MIDAVPSNPPRAVLHLKLNEFMQMQVNLCEPNPCGLNQKCIDHGNNVSCECIPGLDPALCAEMNSVRLVLYFPTPAPLHILCFKYWISSFEIVYTLMESKIIDRKSALGSKANTVAWQLAWNPGP